MPKVGPHHALAAAGLGAMTLLSGPAQAGKVHWKEDAAARGCFALAFDDTDEWFATPQGIAFKKGVCFGQRIRYKVVLAPDQENFTVSGANLCHYHVGDGHRIEVMCGSGQAR